MRRRQDSHSGLQGAAKTTHQMESSAYDMIVRPPTPQRSDGEISNCPSIDQCQVAAKIFVKFVSSRSCAAAYKVSNSVDCFVLRLEAKYPICVSYAQCSISRNEYIVFETNSLYKFNLAFKRKRRVRVRRDLIKHQNRKLREKYDR